MSARVFLPSSFHVLTDGRGAAHLEVETIMPDIFFIYGYGLTASSEAD
jgi:hypothetical protein